MEKPFIKLFHTPNSGYFYDVGKNEIIRIPENVYLHLAEVMDGKIALEQSNDNYVMDMVESFKELGYLSSKRPNKIQHSATAMVPLLLDRCIDKITLQLTQDCNFRCKYCIYSEEKNLKQRSHAHKSMSLETAKKAILFYRDHAVDANMYNVGFYGGEPLLEWDLLKELVLFAEKELMGKKLTFSLTTNASLITESVAEFLDMHHINTTVSLDGIPEVNDLNRVFDGGCGTSETVLNVLRMIREQHPSYFKELRISSVIDPKVNTTLFGNYPKILEELLPINVLINLEESLDQEIQIPNKLVVEMEREVLLAYLAEFGLYTKVVKPYGYNRANQLRNVPFNMKSAAGMPDVMAPGGPCIPGKSRLMVTVDGNLYPCERVIENEGNCIGNLEKGFYIEKIQQIINVGSITEDKCRSCWAMRLCTVCIKQFDYTREDAAIEKTRLCESIKSSAWEEIRGMLLFYEFETYYKNRLKRSNEV